MTPHIPSASRRAALLVLLAVVLALLASSDLLHARFVGLLAQVEGVIGTRPVLGKTVFVLFSAASAMLAFVSSAIVIPVGIYAWGNTTTLLLLWLGWILGGACAYGLSRWLGRRVVQLLQSGLQLERFEARVTRQSTFPLVLLLQLALPSELPGYLLGLVRYNFWKYLAALALAELPYAIADVYLGSSFIERRTPLLIGTGVAVAALSGWAIYALQRRWR